jgi:hypothetical protein
VHGYLDATNGALCVPKDHDELKALLDAFVMEKAVYKFG